MYMTTYITSFDANQDQNTNLHGYLLGSERKLIAQNQALERVNRGKFSLTIAAVCLITIVSGPAYVGSAAARGAGWNQVAADAAGRAYAVEGKYSPFNGPCPAPQGSPHAYRTPRLCATQQHEPQTP
jgi:hypothetical protein